MSTLIPTRWAAIAAALLPSAIAVADGGPLDLEFQKVTDGVYLAFRPEPIRPPVEGNVTLLINDRDVVVVDGSGTPYSARQVIAWLQKQTDKPVSYLVNTHWHGDHNLGNQAWVEAYPRIEIVAHIQTRHWIDTINRDYLENSKASLDATAGSLRRAVETGRAEDGSPLPEHLLARQRRVLEDLPVLQRALAEARVVPPTMVFDERLVLQRGAREIQMRFLGRGNTDGDAIVYLPAERIVITGDLVVLPTPYGYGSFPADWIETLQTLNALEFDTLIPGHGSPQADRRYVELLLELLGEVRRQVGAGVARGEDLETIRAGLDLAQFRQRLAGNDPTLARLFDVWFVQPITRSAYLEARGEPIEQKPAG